jgi:16S rRNA (guanine527-N7)-methyltransferase
VTFVQQRLAELARKWSLPQSAAAQLGALLELIDADPEAPTAVRERREAVDVHVADSLSALGLDAVRGARTVVDVGAGAGFPGLALAVALPEASFDLVESSVRKAAFIERAIGACGLSNARAVPQRAERWAAGEGAGSYQLATARAVAPLATVIEYAAPLLVVGGTLVAWKGRRDVTEERQAAVAGETLGLLSREVSPVQPFAASRERHLHVFQKVGPTSPGYPRRAGMARKRPLGGR